MPSTPELSVNFGKDKAMRDGLREPFPPEQIGTIPAGKGRPALDYVGHAAVTDRLNAWAPGWTYTVDELLTIGGACWIRGTMVVGQVARVEFGDGKDPKEAIGNFIRRGAMRFGVALDLWSREELQASGGSTAQPSPEPSGQPAQRTTTDVVAGPPDQKSSPMDHSGETTGTGGEDAVEEVGGQGEGTPASEAATPDQWMKLGTLGMAPRDVIRTLQGQGLRVTRKIDVTRAQLAEVLESFGVRG